MRILGTCGRMAAATAGWLALAAPTDGLHAQSEAYLDFEALTTELRSLVNGSDMVSMRSLGASHEGREIWLLEIGNPAGPALDTRPGLLVVGNLAGDHLVGSSLAVDIVRYFLTADAADEDVAKVLDEQVVYVVPRLNPDGAEAMFARVRNGRRGNAQAFDDDNDGRVDEDPPEDLNGDGIITVMRVPDPSGSYIIDPDEPRLMRSADATEGESGAYTLYWEGTDSDGDGYLNEDGPGGVDLNRNFQHAYPYWQRDAGQHMVSEPETRALMDFVVAHRNIAAILAFGHSDNLVTPPDAGGNLADAAVLDLAAFAGASNADALDQGVFRVGGGGGGFGFGFGGGGGGSRLRGAQPGADNDPSSGRRPATTVNERDRKYFETVSDAYKEITGITSVGINREAEGAFFQFGYFQFGVPSFSTQGWALPEAASEESDDEPAEAGGRAGQGRGADADGAASTDAKVLAALEGAGIDAFVDWTSFAHPDLGEVEIGGFRPYAAVNPPADELAELGSAHGAFAVRLAGMIPRVEIADTEVENHGGGVFTVSVEVANTGYFPTSLQHGVVSRSVRPTIVQIQVPPEAILTGAAKTSTVQRLEGSGARERFSWVIRGQQGTSVEIRVRSQKGGTATATVMLR